MNLLRDIDDKALSAINDSLSRGEELIAVLEVVKSKKHYMIIKKGANFIIRHYNRDYFIVEFSTEHRVFSEQLRDFLLFDAPGGKNALEIDIARGRGQICPVEKITPCQITIVLDVVKYLDVLYFNGAEKPDFTKWDLAFV